MAKKNASITNQHVGHNTIQASWQNALLAAFSDASAAAQDGSTLCGGIAQRAFSTPAKPSTPDPENLLRHLQYVNVE